MAKKEIKRNSWAQFFRKFNAANQYRHINITIKEKANQQTLPLDSTPFLGLGLEKKGRLIDGVQLFTGRPDTEEVISPVLSLKQPDKIVLEKDGDGHDTTIIIRSKDGLQARLELGEKDRDGAQWLVEKLAYTMFERRGCGHGRDMDDWLTAEKRVKDAELMLVR